MRREYPAIGPYFHLYGVSSVAQVRAVVKVLGGERARERENQRKQNVKEVTRREAVNDQLRLSQ